ncbi:MAG: Stage 0 sporulation A-like protein [Oscillospiraceae bacterium]|jgi:two-component system, chemotaxis family, protein-glutamate methylesterase/glutaminase
MPFQKIKVLIVDRSLELLSRLSKAMPHDSAFKEVKIVHNFSEAVSALNTYQPDVILAGDQLEGGCIEDLIKSAGVPVVVMYHSENGPNCQLKGAADFVLLPEHSEEKSWQAFCSEVCVKVKIAAVSSPADAGRPKTQKQSAESSSQQIIVIGASTGGTDATAEIIKHLPDHLPGIVIVQHMPSGFTKLYADRLNGLSGIHVSEAKDGDRVKRGSALIAPGGLHLVLKKDKNGYYVNCIKGKRVNGHCPSVDVLFDSAAKTAGPDAIGVILTGMGKDGAKGLLHMRQAGAYTIGQDQETSVVYGMPMEAYKMGAVVTQAPLQKIANLIIRRFT